MKFLILAFLFLLRTFALGDALHSGVSLYAFAAPSLKIYSASANLAHIYRLESENSEDSAVARKLNQKNLQDIASFEALRVKPEGAELTQKTLSLLQKNLMDHPVAGRNPRVAYDDQNGQIGFCYGRALLVQKELERLGVSPDHIFKVFLVGELSQQGLLWDYHVATMYVDNSGRKWMIDSLNDEVMQLSGWYKSLHQYFLNPAEPRVRVYFAEASKFQARSGEFTHYDVLNPLYKTFFFDLALWL
jgi:hypothetical protein